jgi:hypothetical protein
VAEREEQERENTDEREGSEDASVVPKAVMSKMTRDKCYRRLPDMAFSQRFAAFSRPLRGFSQTASLLGGQQ